MERLNRLHFIYLDLSQTSFSILVRISGLRMRTSNFLDNTNKSQEDS